MVGNALSRGNEAVEYLLDRGLRYSSGPQWLAENLLLDRHVLAVAGTHGKTSTAGMLAWILEAAATHRATLERARFCVITRACIDIHFLILPCLARAQAWRDRCRQR